MALLGLLLLVPAGAATETFSLGGFASDGSSYLASESSLIHVEGTRSLNIEITGELFDGVHYTTTQYDAGVLAFDSYARCDANALVQYVQNGATGTCSTKENLAPLAEARMVGVASAEPYYLRIFNLDGGALDVHGDREVDASAHPMVLAAGGKIPRALGPPAVEEGDPPAPTRQSIHNVPVFTTQDPVGPQLLTRLAPSTSELAVQGDLVVEILGPEVLIGAPDSRSVAYETGIQFGETTGIEEDVLFMRLVFHDARINLRTDRDGIVDFVATEVSLSSDTGALDIRGATVDLPGATRVSADVQRIDQGYDAVFQPQSDGSGNVQFAPGVVAGAAPWMDRAMETRWFWWVGGASFILVIAAVAIRQSTAPPLPRIESALEEGSYRKAVKMSSRVLRRDPGHESAQLARAIAWSRMGAHDRIVRHLEPFLRRHEPSDGTLHYVFGLALHERGRDDAARDAMRHAVQRTPSLLPDVDASLRPEAQTEGYS